MQLIENFSLKKFNTFGIDVQAHLFTEITCLKDFEELISIHHGSGLPLLPLGGGSNILFTKDYTGLVAKISNKGIKIISENENDVLIEAAAGELWEDLIGYCIKNKYYGLENLSGIPGQVGSSPIQNIGAYGVEVKDCIKEVGTIDLDDGRNRNFSGAECNFSYRDSIFKRELKNKVIITNVVFKLSKVEHFNLKYGGVLEEIRRISDETPGIAAVSKAISNIRGRKIPEPKDLGSAGSFFKNPVITNELFEQLIKKYPDMPNYPANDNKRKLAAGWLVEQCGWKGYRAGDAGVCENQALILVNFGNVSGTEILELSKKIRESIFEKFGINIDPEVNIL